MCDLLLSSPTKSKLETLRRDETGAVTLWMTFWMMAFLTLGSIAVDTSQAWRVKAMLQSASDAAAYGGAIALARRATIEDPLQESQDPVEVVTELVDDILTDSPPPELPVEIEGEDPVEVALSMARRNLPPDILGDVLLREDVELGLWDPVNREFVPSNAAPNAIRVTLRRAHRNDNPEPTFLAGLAGFFAWDIEVQSVARTFISPRAECIDPVLTARTRVDVQTNDVWVGICVHARANVAVDTSQQWLSDEVVDVIDRIMLETMAPYEEEAQTAEVASLDLNVLTGPGPNDTSSDPALDYLDDFIGKTKVNGGLKSMIANLTANATTTLERDDFDFAELIANASYHVTCNDNQTLYIPGRPPVENVVILSDCPVRVAQNAYLKNTVIISNLDALKHIELTVQAPSGVTMGAQDQCGPGDGVRVMVYLDVETAARLRAFDPELYPLGDVLVAAQREGGGPESPVDVGVHVDIDGDFLTGAVLEGLLGVCVGAEYLLEVNAFALAE